MINKVPYYLKKNFTRSCCASSARDICPGSIPWANIFQKGLFVVFLMFTAKSAMLLMIIARTDKTAAEESPQVDLNDNKDRLSTGLYTPPL
jgi:hypothetical protein